MLRNLATVEHSTYNTWHIQLNGVRVGETTNKVRAEGVATWLNQGRGYGFVPEVVAYVMEFADAN